MNDLFSKTNLSDFGGNLNFDEFNPSKVSPSSSKGSSLDNKSNPFMSQVLDFGKGLATYAGKKWVDKQIGVNDKTVQVEKEQAQFATNYWDSYNGSGPVDGGLAAVNARLGNTGQFYANPIENARNPQPPATVSTQAVSSNAMLFGGLAFFGLLMVLILKRK